MILDYLFYQSIQAQLQNSKTKDDFSPKDKNAIQSVISSKYP
jgi:hypothetical protein